MSTFNLMLIPDAEWRDGGYHRARIIDQSGTVLWEAPASRLHRSDALSDAEAAVELLRYEKQHQLQLAL